MWRTEEIWLSEKDGAIQRRQHFLPTCLHIGILEVRFSCHPDWFCLSVRLSVLPKSWPDLLPILQPHVLIKISFPDVVAYRGKQVCKGLEYYYIFGPC